MRTALAAVFAASLASTGLIAQSTPHPEGTTVLLGRTIVSVSCVADGPFDGEDVARLLAVTAGRPLTEDDTASTIRNLYATRRFADVRIEAEAAGDGAAVTVVLFCAYHIHPLVFAGRVPIARAELRRALPFAQDALFSSPAVDRGAAELERRLQADGYLSARVRAEVSLDATRFNARVTYRIEPGPPARVAEPFFDGDPAPFSVADLRSRMRLKPGDRYLESAARADATRMTDFLHGKDRYRAAVELIAAQATEDGRIVPVYRVRVGPQVVFEGRGITPAKLAKELHALAEAQPIDEELVLQFVDGRKEALQRSGNYRAAVTYAFDAKTDPALTRIRVEIIEGRKFFVQQVRFAGNAAVSDRTLYGLMATRKKGLPFVSPGRLIDAVLSFDADTILAYYQSNGWIRAKVSPPRVEDGTRPGALVVVVAVEEGPRATVESRTVAGSEHLDASAASALLSVREGKPFNPNAVREDVSALTAWYHGRGWREAAVKDEMALSEDGTHARITYRVDEGLRSFFGKTIVRGNSRTTTRRIARLVTWKEGDAVSESNVLETQRRLSRSGVFRRVEVRPQRADPVTQNRNVEIEVEEGRPWSLLYGVGYQYSPGATDNQNDPYLAGGVSYNNVLGRMISAGLEAQYAPFSRRGRVQASLREPFLFDTDYPLNLFGFYSRELIQAVELERAGVALDTSRIVARGLRIGLRYTYQRIEPTNPAKLSLLDLVGLPSINRPIEESTIGPDILFDRRDDIVDPHSGYYLTGSFKYAFPLFSAKAQFAKFSTQATGFVRLFGRGTFVVSARVGGVFPHGPAMNSVPIGEQFLAGGRSTNRAFDTEVLGIPGETVDYSTIATPHTGSGKGSCATSYPNLSTYDCNVGPRIVGGNGFFALNAELRIPIAGNLGGVVFWDAAQAWKDFSQVRFQFEGERGLRQGVGFGLRYLTPIGPVRVEYGWPVNARTIGFDIVQPLNDASGNPIPCKAVPAPPCVQVLGNATTKEKGRLFLSIGYPF